MTARRQPGAPAAAPPRAAAPRSVELFSGGGGLALGVAAAGFEHLAVSENRRWAVRTLLANKAFRPAGAEPGPEARRNAGDHWADPGTSTREWPLLAGDVHGVDWSVYRGRAALVAAGAPCQPFSLGGSHRGNDDDRNLFPEAVRAVREIRPAVAVVENVRGLTRESFRPYLEYILDQLRLPSLAPRDGEEWPDHHARLRARLRRLPDDADGRYDVGYRTLNAADYGLPQVRHRVFIVTVRSDLAEHWAWPEPTHSVDALLWNQMHGYYWDEHRLKRRWPHVHRAVAARIPRDPAPPGLPWLTLRDALRGMPWPVTGRNRAGWHNHRGVPGARLYRGHTGNRLDWPAKTVKAGVHGSPGGEHILVRDDGQHRYLTVRECARLQGFPDDYRFDAPRTEAMRQIGNAVPVGLPGRGQTQERAQCGGVARAAVEDERLEAVQMAREPRRVGDHQQPASAVVRGPPDDGLRAGELDAGAGHEVPQPLVL